MYNKISSIKYIFVCYYSCLNSTIFSNSKVYNRSLDKNKSGLQTHNAKPNTDIQNTIEKTNNMKIDHTNKQAIHDVLITDMQRLMFRQYNELKVRFNVTDEDYDVQQTLLIDNILNCNSINDINELILNHTDLFDAYDDITKFTLDGTLNYVLRLLIESCKSNVEYA